LENITDIWYILWPCGNLVYFSPFLSIVLRKIWQPCSECEKNSESEFQRSRSSGAVRPEMFGKNDQNFKVNLFKSHFKKVTRYHSGKFCSE
jgi:hypothetical protein